MKCITYYTVNTPYEQEVLNLIRSANEWGYKVIAYPRTSNGDWESNCATKVDVIQQAMDEFKDDDILWLDADSVIVGTLDLFHTLKPDVVCAVHSKRPPRHVISSVVFIRNNEAGRRLTKAWRDCINKSKLTYLREQEALGQALCETGTKWLNLPESYCHIFDARRNVVEPAHITQMQASRRFKATINRKVT